jgi:hypothetical protein
MVGRMNGVGQHDHSVKDQHDGEHPEACCDGHSRDASTSDTLQIFPPPAGIHSDCEVCNDSYYTVKGQEEALVRYKTGEDSRFYGYKGSPEDDTAAQEMFYCLMTLVDREFEDLKDALKSHGDLVLSRWAKKSKDKRGMTLHTAAQNLFGEWPPRSEQTFCSLMGKRLDSFDGTLSMSMFCGTGFCGAWVNIEDFATDRMKLLSFLQVRSTYAPSEWALFDASETGLYFRSPISPIPFNANCINMCGENYGQMVETDVELMHRGVVLGFPRAIATVHVQLVILCGLRMVVDEIVAGALPSGDLKWSKLVSGSLQSSINGTEWGVYDSQGFAPPAQFDPFVLSEMALEQLYRHVDEVELLQVDPEYMRSYALNMKANISWDTSVSPSSKWSYIAGTIAMLMTHRLSHGRKLVDKSRGLVKVFQGDWGDARTRLEMPEAIEPAILDCGNAIVDMIDIQLVHLQLATSDMEALKEIYTKFEERGVLYQRSSYTGDFKKQCDRIEHAHWILQNHGACRGLSSARGALRNLSAELSKVGYDNRVDEICSTIALLDAMQKIWLLSHTFSQDDLRSTHVVDKIADKRVDALASRHTLIAKRCVVERYGELGVLLRDFCESPRPKNRYSPAWLDRRTETRTRLAKFWQRARDDWKQHQDDTESSVVDAVVRYLSFDVSSRYLAEVEEERTTFGAELRRSPEAKPSDERATHAVQSVWGTESESPKLVRMKAEIARPVKPNELDIAGLDLNVQLVGADSAETPKLTILVKQDSKRFFDKVFSRTATASNFRWTHLVIALTDAGMVATQAPGSAVRFRNDRGAIVFHQPHGNNHDSTLGADFLCNQIGKRLTKWFKWDRETFVGRKKGGQ